MNNLTDNQRAARIRALIDERAGYLSRGLPKRAAEVDAQLAVLGEQAAAPADRAVKRVTRSKGKRG